MEPVSRAEAATLKPIVLARGNHECAVCGFAFSPVLVVHHIVPISEGGTNALTNLVVLCPTCHALVHKVMQWLRLHLEQDADPDALADYHQYRDWMLDRGSRWQNDMDRRLWHLARKGKGLSA